MTQSQAPDQDVSRAIRSWLHEERHEDASRVAGAVLDQVEATPQRRATWWSARRMPVMNKFVSLGLGAAAVVVALIIGTQVLGPPAPSGVGVPPSASPSPSNAPSPSPTPAPEAGLPQGPTVVSTVDDPVQTTVDIAASGWYALPEFDALSKDDDSQDPPTTVGAALLAWAFPVGTRFHVYGDPCSWLSTIPETPATTPDEIAAAFASQAASDPTAPVDVTVGGYTGTSVTLRVPLSYEVPGATREEEFGDCDEDQFVYYGIETADATEPARNAQGPGQIDELWILDVDGAIVILDAVYSPATPPELVDEMRALAESATFE